MDWRCSDGAGASKTGVVLYSTTGDNEGQSSTICTALSLSLPIPGARSPGAIPIMFSVVHLTLDGVNGK